MDIGGVYIVNFPRKGGNEIYGQHYAVVLSSLSKDDKTLLVAPITGKKNNKKYRGGITIDNRKYQTNPSYTQSFIYIRKYKRLIKENHLSKKETNR